MMDGIRNFLSEPGVISAAGTSAEALWKSVTTGDRSGIRKVRTSTGGEFYAARTDDSALRTSSAKYDMRIMRLEEAALDMISGAVEKAKSMFPAERIAVCVGSCDNGTEFSVSGHREFFTGGKFPENYSLEIQGADYVASFVSEKFGLKGPSATFSTACSSSAVAMIKAAELINASLADAVVTGGVDIASDTVLLGFNSLEAVSPEMTNPFSVNRRGITLGEAAAFFVMSRVPLQENAPGIELLGWGEAADAYHMTSPDPSGKGAESAIRRALNSAGLEPSQIDYINLHGTGTKFNDSMEAKAVNSVFADLNVPVSSTKSVTGHTLGAAAALEAAICWMAVKNGAEQTAALPLQVWDRIRDPEIPELNFVSPGDKIPESGPIRKCLSNSFAFGGADASLIIGVR